MRIPPACPPYLARPWHAACGQTHHFQHIARIVLAKYHLRTACVCSCSRCDFKCQELFLCILALCNMAFMDSQKKDLAGFAFPSGNQLSERRTEELTWWGWGAHASSRSILPSCPGSRAGSASGQSWPPPRECAPAMIEIRCEPLLGRQRNFADRCIYQVTACIRHTSTLPSCALSESYYIWC